ncbi:MAG: putative DNA binding domain-containing protein [Actinobacteria bacterium]|nr:putative DNA binding domain-containing protein [Actinomycetota bacterium]MBI3687439.1 putative DNA binding domain-containing protein [Actinomycetota bacterium]
MTVAAEVHRALAEIRSGAVPSTLESATLDFKQVIRRSLTDTCKDLAEAAVCFANAQGGSVVVGVADAVAGPAAIQGCDLETLVVQRRIYELTDPRLTVTVEPLISDGQRLVVISVPASPDVHQVGGRATERVGTSCHPMAASRIATVVGERRGEDWSAADSGVDPDHAVAPAMMLCRTLLGRSADPVRRDHAQHTDLDLLRRLGLLTASGTLVNAGALLLTADPRHAQTLAYVHRRTPAGELTANEHLGGPLVESLLRVLDRIEARVERTPVNLPGGQQLQLADLPEAAIREAVVNAVTHRDYRRPGPVRVEHAATRLVVTSPGPFLSGITPDNVLTTSPRSRNACLSNAIRTLGLAETAGIGVDRMYAEMARLGHQPPTYTADLNEVRVTLLGGAPNSHLARFVSTLPAGESEDAETLLVLLTLLSHRTVTADQLAPLFQKSAAEVQAVLDRLASPSLRLIERTRESVRRSQPVYRLQEGVVATLGPAVTYRRRTPDQHDRKIIGLVREAGSINSRVVQIALGLDPPTASRILGDLVARQILIKTSTAQRGASVTYGPGERFPVTSTARRRQRKDQP